MFNYGAEISAKRASQPASCNQALSSIARFYALFLDLTDFFKVPRTHTQNFSPPPPTPATTSSYLRLYIKWTCTYPRSLHTSIIKNNRKTKTWTESLTKFKISTSMFSTIDNIFHNHYFISTDYNYTIPSITTLALWQPYLYATPKITFTFQNNIFCYFIANCTRNQFHWLTNYSYLTNPSPI